MSEKANVDTVLGIYDAFSRGDVEAILNQMDPQADLQFEAPSTIPWAGLWRGREGWAKFFQTVGENLDEIILTMEPVAAQGDNVVAAGRYQGRVKRTGNRIDSPLVHLWTIRNGMVVHCQEMTDTAAEVAACTSGTAATG
jgi:uncharacterized protein